MNKSNWIEILVENKKDYKESLSDIRKLLEIIPHRRFFFFFESEFGINYVLRLETELSLSSINKLIEQSKGKIKDLHYFIAVYELEHENFKPLIEECLDLFHAYSQLALKLDRVPLKERGKRLKVEDLSHLLANTLGYEIEDEAKTFLAFGAERETLRVLLKFNLLRLSPLIDKERKHFIEGRV